MTARDAAKATSGTPTPDDRTPSHDLDSRSDVVGEVIGFRRYPVAPGPPMTSAPVRTGPETGPTRLRQVTDPIDLDQVLAEVLDAASQARASGVYPDGLEEQLQSDFARQLRRDDPRDRIATLRHELALLDAARGMARRNVATSSSMPGGSAMHKAIGKAVGRQVDGVYEQLDGYTSQLMAVLANVIDAVDDPKAHVHSDLIYELNALEDRVAELQNTLDRLGVAFRDTSGVLARTVTYLDDLDGLDARLARLEEAERRRRFDPFFDYGDFEDIARGAEADMEIEYAGLADRLSFAPGPIVDVGAGRGEFLRLLNARGVEAWGVEIDEALVLKAEAEGLDIRLSDGLEVLRDQPFGSLGAIVLLHVIEHLTPNELLELIELARDRLMPTGMLVMETPNPQSLYIFARAFWLDPTHSKPVHPKYLEFALKAAGFDAQDWEWTQVPGESERLLDAVVDGEVGEVVAENAKRVNDLLFAAQNYRVIAHR